VQTEPQSITLDVNGHSRVAALFLADDLREYQMRVPGRTLKRNLNVFRFRFKWAVPPARLGMSPDRRELAALFDYIQLIRDRSDDEKEEALLPPTSYLLPPEGVVPPP
jgi:hypothetical protein